MKQITRILFEANNDYCKRTHRQLDVSYEESTGVVKFNIQHTQGELARIFVHALTQEEAEHQVDDWFSKGEET